MQIGEFFFVAVVFVAMLICCIHNLAFAFGRNHIYGLADINTGLSAVTQTPNKSEIHCWSHQQRVTKVVPKRFLLLLSELSLCFLSSASLN